ncbi:MAG TPA: hypothetical protein VF230_13155 [Acidimicrobiales bacterium]
MNERRRRDPALAMRPQDQAIAYALASFATAVFASEWQPWKGGQALTGFVVGVFGVGALATVARQGHRVWTAFAAFLNGFNPAWGFTYVFGALFIAYAFWLGWRTHRDLKASLDVDPTRVTGTPMPPASSAVRGRVTPKGTTARARAKPSGGKRGARPGG